MFFDVDGKQIEILDLHPVAFPHVSGNVAWDECIFAIYAYRHPEGGMNAKSQFFELFCVFQVRNRAVQLDAYVSECWLQYRISSQSECKLTLIERSVVIIGKQIRDS